MENEIKISDEVLNYSVKNDIILTRDYFKLIELKETIDVLIKNHLEEIKERTKENKTIGNYEVVTKYGKNIFSKELANAWLEKNLLVERFTIIKPEHIIPAVKEIDFKEVQKELKNRYKDTYNKDFCIAKEQGIELKIIK